MGDGDCLFHTVLKQLSFKQEVHEWVFAPVFLRRMLIVHYLKCRKDNDNELFWCVRKCLFAYGLPEGSEVGSFSIRSYFKHMVKDKTWDDIVCLYLIASMWSLRVTVLNSSTLGEMRIRHNMSFSLVDLPIVFNSHEVYGHFSACIRGNKERLLAGKLLKSNGYHVEKDIADRLLHSSFGAAELLAYSGLKYIVMSQDKFQKMVKSGVALKDIKAIVESMEEGGFIEGRDVHDKPKEKERPVHKEQEVQVYKLGDTKCVKCDEDFDKSYLLQRHLDRYHRGLFEYHCPECNKGLSTASGLKEHLLTHKGDATSHICPNCGKGFTLKRIMNQHIKEQHDNYGPRYCQYKWGRVCYVHKNIVAHEKGCKNNPNRKPKKCIICGEAKWYTDSQLNYHKLTKHGIGASASKKQ